MNYHVHSKWVNDSTTSDLGSEYCGPSYTAYHYDPTLACSTASENQGTSMGFNTDNCQRIGRYATASPAYTYGYSTEVYSKGDFSQCELGDLSGKHGSALPSGGLIFDHSNILYDAIPVYSYNYLKDSGNNTGPRTAFAWASIVFHCRADDTRLFCAKFIEETTLSNDSSCGLTMSSKGFGANVLYNEA